MLLATLGVVYGDIGTSPLYALRECFYGSHAVEPTHENVLGVLSLIIYSLVLVISIKYIALVLRADNHGEGGILALTALLPARGMVAGRIPGLVLLGLFGAALLYGDGMITPAITVLGAIEGLNVATPVFEPYVVPITVAIIVAVFAIQQHGTARIGGLFGPVMVLWFVTIAALGVRSLLTQPEVLGAIDPRHAVWFFGEHGLHGVAVLGAVFLVVTGGEALYADMGHFGTRPIRVAWFGLVLPALLLNYFGQGALLLTDARAAIKPVLQPRAGLGHPAAGRARGGCGHHRVAGAHLGCVLADEAGHPARDTAPAWTSSTRPLARSGRCTSPRRTGHSCSAPWASWHGPHRQRRPARRHPRRFQFRPARRPPHQLYRRHLPHPHHRGSPRDL